MQQSPKGIEGKFKSACSSYRAKSSYFSASERLALYGLYKQAMIGDAPKKYSSTLPILRATSYAAWSRLEGKSKKEAKEKYIELVNATLGEDSPSATTASRSEAAVRKTEIVESSLTRLDELLISDEALLSSPLNTMSREELEDLATRLRDKVRTLWVVGNTIKKGELTRFRDTMTGGDWSPRWFEVVPGFLRCYRSRSNRELRLEISLSRVVSVRVADDGGEKSTRRFGTRYVLVVQLEDKVDTTTYDEKTTASAKIVSLNELRLSTGSAADRDDWIKAIAAAAKTVRPMAPPTSKGYETDSPSAKTLKKNQPGSAQLKPVHTTSRPSLLSSDSQETVNFTGLVNLVAVIALVSNLRHLFNEWHTLPLLSTGSWWRTILSETYTMPTGVNLTHSLFPSEVILGMSILLFGVLASYLTELQRFKYANLLHLFLCFTTLIVPVLLVIRAPSRPVIHFAWLFELVVVWMKLVSWCHTNVVLRQAYTSNQKHAMSEYYPQNLTMKNLLTYHVMPTLIYQPSYPRTQRIRKRWLIKRFIELGTCITLIMMIVTQFIIPTVISWLEDRTDKSLLFFFERLLALAIPSIAVWILIFYSLFELWLSILAEISCFGDRLFYRDWWNANRLDEYWRLWNIPVHRWLVRHVYFVSLDFGLSKYGAMIIVFLVSAILHELLVSAPCHVLHLYAFGAMMAQIPLIFLTNILYEFLPRRSRIGNWLFWVSFCIVGQPMCLMLYFRDSITLHDTGDRQPDNYCDHEERGQNCSAFIPSAAVNATIAMLNGTAHEDL